MPHYEELRISMSDGYAAYARYWPAAPFRGAVLMLHGIQSHCGWFEESAARLRDAGFAVLQPDRRGSGRNPVARGHASSAQRLIEDAIVSMDALRARTGTQRPHLMGISWGGKLAAAVHATDPAQAASLLLVTPGLFPVVDVSPAEKFRMGCAMVASPEKAFDIPLNDPELFTSDRRWMDFLREDPWQIHQATAAFFLASRRMDRIAQSLSKVTPVPLHLFLAADERIIDNDQTRAFVHALSWPQWTITTYEHSRHTLEFDPDREEFFTDLVSRLIDPKGEDL